jgi:hypothetical protein
MAELEAKSSGQTSPPKMEDPGAAQAALIGAGRTGDRLVEGVKQGGMGIGAIFAQLLPDDLKNKVLDALTEKLVAQQKTQEGNTAAYKPLADAHPIATGLGEAAPLIPLPMGGSIKSAMAIGAIPGALEYGDAKERGQRGASGAIGSGIGYGLGKALGAVVSPGMKAASPEADRLAKVAMDNGIPLDPAQVTGNQVLQNAKSALSRIPWTATGEQAAAQNQQQAFNAAMLKRIGADAKVATPDVMADAHAAIISKMNKAAGSTSVVADDAFVNGLAKVERTYLRRLPTDQKPVIGSYLEDLTNIIGKEGGLPGDVYNSTRSELGRIAAETNNNTVRQGAKDLQRVLDDAFDRQAPKEAVRDMKEARSQYAKYLTTAEAQKKGRSTAGDIPAKQAYAQALQDIPGFERKTGDFEDLVRAGRKFLPDPTPNSGTPERLMYQNLLTAGSMGGLGALGGTLSGGDAVSGASLGLAGFGLSKGAQGLLHSPQFTKYLMSHKLTEAEKKLLARSGGLLGLGVASGNSP